MADRTASNSDARSASSPASLALVSHAKFRFANASRPPPVQAQSSSATSRRLLLFSATQDRVLDLEWPRSRRSSAPSARKTSGRGGRRGRPSGGVGRRGWGRGLCSERVRRCGHSHGTPGPETVSTPPLLVWIGRSSADGRLSRKCGVFELVGPYARICVTISTL